MTSTEMSQQQEAAVGTLMAKQIIQKKGGLYPDKALARMVTRIGGSLTAGNGGSQVPYNFVILNDSSLNCYAIPGGYIAISRGLISYLKNEGHLAAILAHAIAHIEERHGYSMIERSPLRSLSVAQLKQLSGSPVCSAGVTQVQKLTAQLMDMRYSESMERSADRKAADLLVSAGYNPASLIDMQQSMVQVVRHVSNTQRLLAAQQYVAESYAQTENKKFNPATYNRAVAGLKETAEAYGLYDRALETERKQQFQQATELYHLAMQQQPEHGLLLTALGMSYLRQEDLVPARRYLLRAVRYDPDYFQSRLGLGYIYLNSGRKKEAVAQLEKSLELLPTLQGTFLLAEAQKQAGQTARAAASYRCVIDAKPGSDLGRTAAKRLKALE